ncbi:MAG: arylsulfatase [Chloroflexi bacterium]|nr:arylsulfatase [Chloroflexota bacterium]
MADVRVYPEGTPFPGVIGRTVSESVPAWRVPPQARTGAPNVLVVLLDDVGFAQFGCFGGAADTPTLDRLAANGLRYRDFHTTALCTPTRACMMTGRNHHATGAAIVANIATGFPGYDSVIPRSNGFLSEMLQAQGYATFMVGKWHLTPTSECTAAGPFGRWPLGRGFERFYGFLAGMTNQWYPDLVEDNRPIAPPSTPEEGYHLNADMADQAISMISNVRTVAPEKPFFLYYCPGAGHTPHHAPKEWIERYQGRFDQGWDRLREEIFAKQVEAGIVPPGTTLSPRPDFIPAWDSLSDDERRLYARQMEVFAAFLSHTDHHLGRVINFLEETGDLDNTLIFITSDNGASAEGGMHGLFNHMLGTNGVEDTVERNLEMLDEWGSPATHPHYSWGWAWAGNTPLRRWKRYVHQGGMSDALIVHWPRGIRAKGEVRGQYAHVTDILPTVLDAAGIEPPAVLNDVTLEPIHGVSFAHTFDDAAAPTRKTTQYYEMFASRALWHDGWKAVTDQKQGVLLTEALLRAQRWELYHVDEDFSECHDLAEQHPDKLDELVERWWTEAGRNNVLPLDARFQGRLLEPKPELGGVRDRYVYYPGAAPVHHFAAANLHNRAHTITADVVIPEGGAEGVILAHGGRFSGYSLFVLDGRLTYVHNYLGLRNHWVRSDERIPAGPTTLRFVFTRTGEHRGIGALYVGDRKVGEAEIPETVPNMHERIAEGLCCGYDSGLPVTDEYRAPFPFTGTIERVVVEAAGERFVDPEAEVRAAMHRQ